MSTRQTIAQAVIFNVIFLFLFNGSSANCVNNSVSYKDLFRGSLEETLPDIPLEKFGNKYYYFGAIYEGNYFQALQYCNYHGMSLLSIESKAENDFLWEKFKPFLGAGEYHFWTSGTTLASNHWVWMVTGRPIIFANWFPNQPDNAGNNEKCLEVRYSPKIESLLWNDHACTVAKHVICETITTRKCISKLLVDSVCVN